MQSNPPPPNWWNTTTILDYPDAAGSVGLSAPLFALAKSINDFTMRFTGIHSHRLPGFQDAAEPPSSLEASYPGSPVSSCSCSDFGM